MFYERKLYEIYWAGDTTEVLEPLEWEQDEKSFERNKTYHGIAVNLATSLTFVKDGKTVLQAALDNDGVNADVRVRKYVKNSQTDVWEIDYEGWVDFNTYRITEDGFNVKLNADPTTTLFKSKLNTKIELERLDSLTGASLNPLPLSDLYIEGRAILLTTQLVQPDGWLGLNLFANNSNTWLSAVRLDEVGDNNAGVVHASRQTQTNTRDKTGTAYPDETFLTWNDFDQAMTYNVNIKFKSSLFWYGSGTVSVKLVVNVYSGGAAMNYTRQYVIWEHNGDINDMPRTVDEVWTEQLVMAIGEGAGLHWEINAGSGVQVFYAYPLSCGNILSFGQQNNSVCSYIDEDGQWKPAYMECSVTVQEDSVRVPSTVKCIKIGDFAQRLNDVVLEGEFESDLLNESDVADLVLTHGMWLRGQSYGMPTFKPLATSFKEFLQSLDAYIPIGIDVYNGKVKLEAREYFYQPYVSIDVGEVSELEIVPTADEFYTSLNIGYKKSIGYEEESGLDEYNRLTQYNTILNKTDNELQLDPYYRADPYGLETVRRENPDVGLGDKSPDDDTKFDDDIWLIDANEVSGQTSLEVSDWSKRFAVAPSGVYSPDTAFNLWFSPINVILRYGKWIKSSLLTYLDSWVSFNYSEGNSSLRTQLIGGNAYSQDVGVPVADFDRSIHQGKQATFKAPVTWTQLNGTTYGKPNRYGQIRFTRFGVEYRGFIMSVKTLDGIGDFTVKLATSISASSEN